jgi:hypothetical protein
MLLFFECAVGGFNVTNLITMIMQIIKLLVEIFQTLISFPKKLSFNVDGVCGFENSCTSFIIQLQFQFAPFMISVHCMAHQTNIVVQTLSILHEVNHLEVVM